jgi:hypothetical protein
MFYGKGRTKGKFCNCPPHVELYLHPNASCNLLSFSMVWFCSEGTFMESVARACVSLNRFKFTEINVTRSIRKSTFLLTISRISNPTTRFLFDSINDFRNYSLKR